MTKNSIMGGLRQESVIMALVGFVVLRFNATLTANVISWRPVTHMCFLTFSHQYTNTNFFPKPPTTFLTCFSRGERRKYARKKFDLNRGSNSQPKGYEFDTLSTEPPGRARVIMAVPVDNAKVTGHCFFIYSDQTVQ